MAYEIVCQVCGAKGLTTDVGHTTGAEGWRLAANHIGAYTCSSPCDAIICEFNALMKRKRKLIEAREKRDRQTSKKSK